MIDIDHLSKRYQEILALDDLTLEINAGEIFGLLGPNGAGKTTLIKILTGLTRPTQGTARIAGFDVRRQSMEVKKLIGVSPQEINLDKELTAYENLLIYGKLHQVPDIKSRIQELLELGELTERAHHRVRTFSGGMQRRLIMVRAIMSRPRVLFLDEPTVGLDPKQIIEVRELIKSLAGDHTIILSTHILPEVSMTCQRVIIINEGSIVASDTTENLTRRLKGSENIYVEVEGPAAQVESKIKAMKGVTRTSRQKTSRPGVEGFSVETELKADLRRDLAALIIQQGWGLLEMRPVGMSLEDVFLHLTTKEEEVSAS